MTAARLLRASGLNNPAVPLTAESLAEWLQPRSKAGARVSNARVHGLPAYYRALAIRSGVEAALPLKVYRRNSRERVQQRTLADAPCPGFTPFLWRQTMRMNGIGWGNAYAHKIYNGADVVVEARPIHPSRVREEPIDVTEENPKGLLYLVTDRQGREFRWGPREVFHAPWMAPDGKVGLSPLHLFRESFGTAIAADDAAASLFANGNRLAGVLQAKKKLVPGGATKLKSRWREATAGAESTGDIVVLDQDTEFKSISIPPRDAELLLSRQWSVTEIARMVGVMPHMIGDTERSTSWGSGIESQFIGWVQTVVYPELVNFEQMFTADLLPGGWSSGAWFAEHALEGLLRGDSAARATFYTNAIQWGWMSRNEVRTRENLEPQDGLDDFLTPSNMTLISIDGKAIPLGGTNGPSAA